MKNAPICLVVCVCLLSFTRVAVPQQSTAGAAGPTELQVDNLKTPLGIDDPTPKLSWQLQDSARGAKQTAYQLLVASSADLLQAGKADVWDSGRVESSQSMNVPYAGPALRATTRYFWQVKTWDATGKAYTNSADSWWETGLMEGSGDGRERGSAPAWRAQWIGYETPEEAEERGAKSEWIANPDAKSPQMQGQDEQRFDYRATITLAKPVRSAALYTTGQDTVSAWINGSQVLTEDPLPPYKQMPWKKFVRAEVTKQLGAGANTIAIEALHYVVNPNGMATDDAPPMIATLVVEYADGTWVSFGSGRDWKTAIHAPEGWPKKDFDDSAWKQAVIWQPLSPRRSEALGNPWIPDSVKALERSFDVDKPIKSARLYATALGDYTMFLNGRRVSQDVLSPGWTDYRERVTYQTYDVTRMIAGGENAISALLAPGWYETPLEWFQQPNNYGITPPALRAQLRIEHIDGTVEWIATAPDWHADTSHILHSELYDGEAEDLRLESPNWGTAQFDTREWANAATINPEPVKIVAEDFQPIRVDQILPAKQMTQPKPGVFVFDFGQNFSGVERLNVQGPAGTEVKIRFAEVLNADGTVYTDNLRTAKATDRFILSGNGVSDIIPQFTFHGFRYAELTGLPAPPRADSMHGIVIHTDAPFTVKLDTGSAMLNHLWSNILWGQRSNFVGLPTDCPQRDERLGWMADAQVFWRAASYNMDLAAFSRKFAADMRGTQAGEPYYGIFAPGTGQPFAGSGAGWSDAGVIIPWTSWLQTGDTTIVEQNWDAMEKYLNAILAVNPDYLWKNEYGQPFGDWLSPEGKTDEVLIATAYWAYDVTLMRQMALATGRTQDEEKYAALFEKIRAAFQKEFVHDDGFIAGADNSPSPFGVINNPNAKSHGGDTQTSYVLALHMNLLPDSLRAAAAKRLVDKIEANGDLLGTGFLGTPYLLEELTKAGYTKLAYTLLLNTRYPSWGYMVGHGATTMWERWNGDQMRDDPSMNSYNHYAYGAVADWIYRYAAGIDTTPLDAGFHTVLLHPVFDERLGHIAFDYDSSYGPIHSDWTVKGSTAEWHVTIPANASGSLALSAEETAKYMLDGTPLTASKAASAAPLNGQGGFKLAPGSYTFAVELTQNTP
jgi:alpha-L-rhamnosidase